MAASMGSRQAQQRMLVIGIETYLPRAAGNPNFSAAGCASHIQSCDRSANGKVPGLKIA